MNSTVYVVTQGTYEDYHIDSIWESREGAEARVKVLNPTPSERDNKARIETVELNKPIYPWG